MTSPQSPQPRSSGNRLAWLAAGLLALGFAKPDAQPVTAELIAQHASIQPGGATKVAVHFDIEPGWHIYAKEPGDAGLPTTVAWEGPAGLTFGPLEWPPHQQFTDPGDIRTFGYSGLLVLASTVAFNPPRNAQGAYPDLTVRAHVEWLACRELCLPGKADVSLAIPVSHTPPVFTAHAELFDHVS